MKSNVAAFTTKWPPSGDKTNTPKLVVVVFVLLLLLNFKDLVMHTSDFNIMFRELVESDPYRNMARKLINNGVTEEELVALLNSRGLTYYELVHKNKLHNAYRDLKNEANCGFPQ